MKKLFIGGVPFSSTEAALSAHIESVAKPETLKIVKDYNTGKSKGFAFVTFKTPEDAKLVQEKLDQVVFEGRRLGIKEAKDSADKNKQV